MRQDFMLVYRYAFTILSSGSRLYFLLLMRVLFYLVLFCVTTGVMAQDLVNPISTSITPVSNVPDDMLAKRSVVFYSSNLSNDQLEKIQIAFQKTGIDAVAYFKSAMVFAGLDVAQKVADFLTKREISFLIQVDFDAEGYSFLFTPFNGTNQFVNNGQPAWREIHTDLSTALQNIFRTAINSQPIKNLLINNYPEDNFPITIIDGRRSDFFAIDLKVDKLAVPWFRHMENDSLLFHFFRENYPFSYDMTEPGQDKKELRSKGFHYELCLIHTEGRIAREILGYPVGSESAFTSVTYPNGELKLKTIPDRSPVYKFYLRHIESGNVFLGTKWDADVSWQDALRNHIKGFKAELKIP